MKLILYFAVYFLKVENKINPHKLKKITCYKYLHMCRYVSYFIRVVGGDVSIVCNLHDKCVYL